ncbi:MAG: AraC family transcriptional regulator [Pyrinomonadaceae bacterium]
MILRRFPGQFNNEADFSFFHRENVVVYARTCEVSFSEHTAPLSIKTCLKGTEIYEINSVPIAVREGKFLVINNDQNYSSYILSNEDVDSFCIFFRDQLDREVLSVFEHSHRDLLDDPHRGEDRPMTFFQNLRPAASSLFPQIENLHREISRGSGTSQIWLDEKCAGLIETLLREHLQTLGEIEKLPLVRRSTRLEIYKRLSLARDFIESCYAEPIDLERLARIACLSPFHFLRLFKTVFEKTPHQYLTGVRLEKARQMIEKEDLSITDICLSVGYENPSSFARLFKSRFNSSPGEFRHRKLSAK